MYYREYTGETCEHCGEPIHYQIVKTTFMGGQTHESRRGPSCWMANCPGNVAA